MTLIYLFFGFILLLDLIFLINAFIIRNYRLEKSEDISVSILVPARNESGTIGQTLISLQAQKYPKEKIEILVGDDGSSDKTGEIIQLISNQDSTITYYRIEPEMKRIEGKAGVLDYLIEKSKGEIVIVADADMTYSENWLSYISTITFKEQKLISGFTGVKGKRIWSEWQNLDWLLNLSGVKILDNMGFKLTAIGNNMAFPRKLYDKTPGFSTMKNFITEDMELLRQMKSVSIDSKLIFSKEILGSTRPADSWKSLIQQRRRWMSGAMKSPFWLIFTWFLRVIFLGVLPFIFISQYAIASTIILLHLILMSTGFYFLLKKLKLTSSLTSVLFFELFYFVANCTSLLYYIFSNKITWKEKIYLKSEPEH